MLVDGAIARASFHDGGNWMMKLGRVILSHNLSIERATGAACCGFDPVRNKMCMAYK